MHTTDDWLQRAGTLRETALAHPAVARLGRAARYETHGRGGVVRGLRLRQTGAGVDAVLSIVLREKVLLAAEGSIPEAADSLRTALQQAWQSFDADRPLRVEIDVVDLLRET